jgi:hypothetical protein
MNSVQVRIEVTTEPTVQTVYSNHLSTSHSGLSKLASIFPERPVSNKSLVYVNVGIRQATEVDAVRAHDSWEVVTKTEPQWEIVNQVDGGSAITVMSRAQADQYGIAAIPRVNFPVQVETANQAQDRANYYGVVVLTIKGHSVLTGKPVERAMLIHVTIMDRVSGGFILGADVMKQFGLNVKYAKEERAPDVSRGCDHVRGLRRSSSS